MIIVREATTEDIAAFSARMRQEDTEEVWSLCRMSGYDGLLQSFQMASECWVGLLDGKLFCIFGCGSNDSGASIWMLFTRDTEYLPISFFRHSRRYLAGMIARHGRLSNYVRPENTFILKWLTWLGITIGPLEPMGVDGIPVHRFWIDRRDLGVH